MHPEIEAHLDEISTLCETHGVERLDLFGSGTGSDFDEKESDLDFIVRFSETVRERSGYADQYLNFAYALERLFDREVDLVTEHSIENPFFRHTVDSVREVVYERRHEKATP